MTGLTTGATNACYVTAIDRAGNESERYSVNVPTKLYRWNVYNEVEVIKPNSWKEDTVRLLLEIGYFDDEKISQIELNRIKSSSIWKLPYYRIGK